jgi:NAD(P)-dependent dehydrogenase (short-subunit alcohol dehydrogenase family)
MVISPCTCKLNTGATSVTGRALCEELCANAATVIMGYHKSAEACVAMADRLTAEHAAVGGRAIPVLCDLSSLKTAQQAATEVLVSM